MDIGVLSDGVGTVYRLPLWGNGHKVMTLLFVLGQEMSKWEYSTCSEALNPPPYPLSCLTSAFF